MEVIASKILSSGNSGVRAESQMPVLVSPRVTERLAMETQGLQNDYLCSGEKTGQLDMPTLNTEVEEQNSIYKT